MSLATTREQALADQAPRPSAWRRRMLNTLDRLLPPLEKRNLAGLKSLTAGQRRAMIALSQRLDEEPLTPEHQAAQQTQAALDQVFEWQDRLFAAGPEEER